MFIRNPESPPHRVDIFGLFWKNWLYEIYKYITRQQPYGGFYQYEIPTTIVISAMGTYYQITGNTAGPLNEMTFASDAITVTYSGKYLVNTTCSYSDGGNTNFETAIFVNGVKDEMSANHASTTGSLNANASGTSIISIVAGDVIDWRIVNQTNTNDAVIEHCSVTITWLS